MVSNIQPARVEVPVNARLRVRVEMGDSFGASFGGHPRAGDALDLFFRNPVLPVPKRIVADEKYGVFLSAVRAGRVVEQQQIVVAKTGAGARGGVGEFVRQFGQVIARRDGVQSVLEKHNGLP